MAVLHDVWCMRKWWQTDAVRKDKGKCDHMRQQQLAAEGQQIGK